MDRKNISTLLSDYHLVVPEIQREYVWGNPKNKSVITQFLRDINDKAKKGDVNVGFLYSYRSGNEHYLIDGQQRFTTLAVLLFRLSLREEECHKQFLELMNLDSVSPAFSYRVRTHTESFLNNLFKSTAKTAADIKNQKWYKSEYSMDTTIESIIGAVDTMTELSDELKGLTYEFVLNHIFFWYFDVAQTSQGEELYITMNSRGEKLSDSEQIKPRLLNKVHGIMKKEAFGKKWDEWEEFFYSTQLRGKRSVKAIDEAMNNVVRVALELVSLGEHDQVKPVEDAERSDFNLEVIETYMNAIKQLSLLNDGKYRKEVERLYGDSNEDRNFFVLKALIVEVLKNKTLGEYERVYQTILNQVRRNKIKSHKDYLRFLHDYQESDASFYDFILDSTNESAKQIFTGHELEKIAICRNADGAIEKAFWEIQASPHWHGEFKALLSWSKIDDTFSFKEFIRIRDIFNSLFNKNEEGWTRDVVRQALITSRMPHYPNEEKFGYTDDEWKDIFLLNSKEFKIFLNDFNGVSDIDSKLQAMKASYPETPENKWAEFVHHDELLKYCNTKHLYWLNRRGWMLVRNSWARPRSVKDQLMYEYFQKKYDESKRKEWTLNIWENWSSCVFFQNPAEVFFDIGVQHKDDDTYYYTIVLSKRRATKEKPADKDLLMRFVPTDVEMEWDEDSQRLKTTTNSFAFVEAFIDHCLSI